MKREDEQTAATQETSRTNGSEGNDNTPQKKLYFYIAAAFFTAGLILLILAFVLKNVGTYALISSMIAELIAVSLLNAQKRYGTFGLCRILRFACYAVMIAAVAVVVIGIIAITV